MPVQGASELLPQPDTGRCFTNQRRIRLGDVGPTGRARLDALSRYCQDLARDDSADAELEDPMSWVVRRTLIEVKASPQLEEWIHMVTWASGVGRRWAERRTSISGANGAAVEVATLWIYVDRETGAPRQLLPDFYDIYDTAVGRAVSARHVLPTDPPADAHHQRWPLRYADLDVLGHVNNAAQWVAVEEALHHVGGPPDEFRAELEYGAGIEADMSPTLWWSDHDQGVDSWLVTDDTVGSVARVRWGAGAS